MDWRYNTIWFDQIQPEKTITWNFKQNKNSSLNLLDIEYAIFWYYKYKGHSFELLPPSEKLIYLELNSANIRDFSGIENFPHLKRLEIHYCTKLENGLLTLKDNLEHLHIDQAKKLQSTDQISKLSKLKVLCLNRCGPLENLLFLKDLPNLVDFRFVDTNILSGDLTPIIEHPSIRSVGFLNKRHYNFSDEKMRLKLKEKSDVEFKDFVYKGEYKTFKYKNYDIML